MAGRLIGTRRALFPLLNGLFLNGGRLTGLTSFASPVALSAGANTLSVKPLGATTAYTLSGVISGSGPLSVAANVTLTADATYTGTTTISSGTLQIGNGSTTGTLGTGAVTDNASLVFNRSNSMTVANAISGTGTLNQNGTGTTVLTATNTYSGTTTVNAGTLQFGDGGTIGTLGSGAASIAAGATLSIRRSDNVLTVANNFSGAGDLSFIGTGTIDQSSYNVTGNSSTLTGTIRLTAARIQVSAATQVGTTCPIIISNGSQLNVTNAITINNPLSIAGNGWVETAGVLGAIRMTAGAIYAGSVTLTAAARIATYASSGTLSGTITGAFNLELVAYNGSGTITLTGNSSTLTSISIVSPLIVELTGASTAITVPSGAALGGGAAITGSVKALTFSAAGSILRVRPLSTTSLAKLTATSLVNAAGFTVAYIAGFTVTAGAYTILTVTSTAAPTLGTITSSGLANIGRTSATYSVTGSAGAWNITATLT